MLIGSKLVYEEREEVRICYDKEQWLGCTVDIRELRKQINSNQRLIDVWLRIFI